MSLQLPPRCGGTMCVSLTTLYTKPNFILSFFEGRGLPCYWHFANCSVGYYMELAFTINSSFEHFCHDLQKLHFTMLETVIEIVHVAVLTLLGIENLDNIQLLH